VTEVAPQKHSGNPHFLIVGEFAGYGEKQSSCRSRVMPSDALIGDLGWQGFAENPTRFF